MKGNARFFEVRYEELVKSPKDCMDKITNFCELSSYDFLYRKGDIIFNIDGKQKDNWAVRRIIDVSNRNKQFENESEIKKYTDATRQKFGY